MKNLKMSIMLLLTVALFTSCEKETTTSLDNAELSIANDLIDQSPILGVIVEAKRNNNNEISGYYFSNLPIDVYPIIRNKEQFLRPEVNEIINIVGDEDNFGYGGTSNPSCSCFDLSNSEIDLGIFDLACFRGNDEEQSWVHDYTEDRNFHEGFVADMVVIEVREKFSDGDISTITIDGIEFNFAVNGYSRCDDAIVQSFTFIGEDAAFANDGIINITYVENGDTIALDWSRVTITSSNNDQDGDGVLNEDDPYPHSNRSETLSIGENDLDIENIFTAEGTTMMDEIDALIAEINEQYDGENYDELHRDFTREMAKITYYWRKDRLISRSERSAISRAAWSANIPYFNYPS